MRLHHRLYAVLACWASKVHQFEHPESQLTRIRQKNRQDREVGRNGNKTVCLHLKSKKYHIQGQSSLPAGAACIAQLQAIWFLWFGLCLGPVHNTPTFNSRIKPLSFPPVAWNYERHYKNKTPIQTNFADFPASKRSRLSN